ncbi:MAG: hypothetical protein COB53_02100 [Elusimicrobia bacterium]|nr:MAG: hypothetical protein COB53_02100 [Elusimicrobiota bacterium]
MIILPLVAVLSGVGFIQAEHQTNWVKYKLEGTPVRCEVPTIGTVQEVYREGRGYSRVMVKLTHGHLMLEYYDGEKHPAGDSFKTLDHYLNNQLLGEPFGRENNGVWQGYETLAFGRQQKKLGIKRRYFVVRLSKHEYLVLKIHVKGPYFNELYPLQTWMRKSMRHAKPKELEKPRNKIKKTKGRTPTRKEPAIFIKNNNPKVPYLMVKECPEGLFPVVKDWPYKGDMLCEKG